MRAKEYAIYRAADVVMTITEEDRWNILQNSGLSSDISGIRKHLNYIQKRNEVGVCLYSPKYFPIMQLKITIFAFS
jgi:hypothetical protein